MIPLPHTPTKTLDPIPGCTCRHCRLTTLLTWYDLVTDRGTASGTSGTGGGPIRMGREWHHRSYQELERCLWLLRTSGHASHRAHLIAYYAAPTRLVNRAGRVKGPTGKLITVDASSDLTRRRERIVAAWIQLPSVRVALEMIGDTFQGDPSLPDAFLRGDFHQRGVAA